MTVTEMKRRKMRKMKTIVVINLRMMITTMKKTKEAMKKSRKKRSSMRMILKTCALRSLPKKVLIIAILSVLCDIDNTLPLYSI